MGIAAALSWKLLKIKMNEDTLKHLLEQVAQGGMSVDEVSARLRTLPYEDLDFARIDHHRALRQGQAEVVYGAGKTAAQILSISHSLSRAGVNVLITRTDQEVYEVLRNDFPKAEFIPEAGCIRITHKETTPCGHIGIVSAGTSDQGVALEAKCCAEFFGAEVSTVFDAGVAGLQRILGEVENLNRMDVLIVVAGMEGALPSVIGGLVPCPIIAVPTSVGYGSNLGGLTALMAMLSSCASGVTVVNIDNGFGAAMAAYRILRART